MTGADELAMLRARRALGGITDSEFAVQKVKILRFAQPLVVLAGPSTTDPLP